MTDGDLIERYLSDLDARLDLPPRTRKRIVGEARDHLMDLVADSPGPSGAAAQSWAIERFGSPGVVARRFAEELAVGASRRAARTGAVTLVLFLVLCDLSTSSLIAAPPGWVSDGPGTLLIWITGQVGLVAGVISLVRARAARGADGVDTMRLRYVVRGLIVLAICAATTIAIAASGVIVALTTSAAHRGSLAVIVALVLVCAIVSAIGAVSAHIAGRRLTAIDSDPLVATGREPLSDLLGALGDGVARAVRRLPAAARAARVARRFDPREHPWRYATLIALLAGSLVPVLGLFVLIAKGRLYGSQLADLALSSPALIAFEGGLVLLGYATLGRYLGLRPTSPRSITGRC